MRIGIFFPTKEHASLDEMGARFQAIEDLGLSSGWLPQSAGFDALTALAVIGGRARRLELGTSVVPSYPRHPVMLAAQALTTSAAVGGRLVMGIGLSHKMAIERVYALSYEKPARHMREYLSILMPLLRERRVDFQGQALTGRSQLSIADSPTPTVILAALQPRMLDLAGTLADGTVTWCTGPITLEEQIVPVITNAAQRAGRPAPRIVVPLPTIVTDDEGDGRAKADEQLSGYGQIPTYRAVLDREGVDGPADISVVGDEASVGAQLRRLEDIGATDFVAIPCGTPADRKRTTDHLATLVA
jgi:5,10-methylenetetrahydromethanopterin reductase